MRKRRTQVKAQNGGKSFKLISHKVREGGHNEKKREQGGDEGGRGDRH